VCVTLRARDGCWVNVQLTPLQHASNDGDF
jgi:hypothetical protein